MERTTQSSTWNVYYRPAPYQPETHITVRAITERTARFMATRRIGQTAHAYSARITRVERAA